MIVVVLLAALWLVLAAGAVTAAPRTAFASRVRVAEGGVSVRATRRGRIAYFVRERTIPTPQAAASQDRHEAPSVTRT